MESAAAKATGGRLRLRARLHLGWRCGDPVEKFFISVLAAGPIMGLLILIVDLALAPGGPALAAQVLLTSFLPIATWPVFSPAIAAVAYGTNCFSIALAEGLLPEYEQEYYRELVRYRVAHGVNGRLRGDVSRALAYLAIYLATVAGAIMFVRAAYPIIHEGAFFAYLAIELPVALGSWIAMGVRTTRRFKDAEKEGFRLFELRRQLDSRLRANRGSRRQIRS